jgi:glycosyltransferase involved in cell wall biosynthesis
MTFVMEQTLGHVAFSKNLRHAIAGDPRADVTWLPVGVDVEQRWESWPVLHTTWSARAALKARINVERHHRRAGRSDLLLFHTQVVSLLSTGWTRDPPPTVISLDSTPLNYDRVGSAYGHATGGSAEERLKFRLNQRAFRRARALVTWSDWARRSLVDEYGVPDERVQVVPPGTDLRLWSEGPSVRGGDAGGPLRIVFVGGDLRRKGGDLLARVFREQFADRCELHLVMKGTDAPEDDGIFVHRDVDPNSDALRALLRSADIFILPTRGDVHSIASIEAMAAGLPVVSTAVGAIDEVVVDGETGFLVPPDDGARLAEAIAALVADPQRRREMGEAGRRRAAERFDAGRNGRRLLEVCLAVYEAEPSRAR